MAEADVGERLNACPKCVKRLLHPVCAGGNIFSVSVVIQHHLAAAEFQKTTHDDGWESVGAYPRPE